nr:hypothetical protein HUO10_005419 [Paraburkholderia busanensis]
MAQPAKEVVDSYDAVQGVSARMPNGLPISFLVTSIAEFEKAGQAIARHKALLHGRGLD